MQQPPRQPSPHGAKAIALDPDELFARYRLFLLIAMTIAAAWAFGISVIFER
jgi:hypothetical protein